MNILTKKSDRDFVNKL